MNTACFVVLFKIFEFLMQISLQSLHKDTLIVIKGWCSLYNKPKLTSKNIIIKRLLYCQYQPIKTHILNYLQ